MCTVDNKKTRSHAYSCADRTGNKYYRVKEKGNVKEGNILVDLNEFDGFIWKEKVLKVLFNPHLEHITGNFSGN